MMGVVCIPGHTGVRVLHAVPLRCVHLTVCKTPSPSCCWDVGPMAGASTAFMYREGASGTEAMHGRTMGWKKLGYLTFICLPATVPLSRRE